MKTEYYVCDWVGCDHRQDNELPFLDVVARGTARVTWPQMQSAQTLVQSNQFNALSVSTRRIHLCERHRQELRRLIPVTAMFEATT